MKKTCVVCNDAEEFQEKCNKLLSEGWEVIPGTVGTSSSSTSYDNGFGEIAQHLETFVAFFKYIEPIRYDF